MGTKVRILKDYEGIFKEGDEGRIDGYVNAINGGPCAVVVINRRFDAVPLSALGTL